MRITARHLRQIIKEELTRNMLNEAAPQDVDVRVMTARRIASILSNEMMNDSTEDDYRKRKHNPLGHTKNGVPQETGDVMSVMFPGMLNNVSIAPGITNDGQYCVLIGMNGRAGTHGTLMTLVGFHSPFESESHLRDALSDAASQEGAVIGTLKKTSRDDVMMFNDQDDPVKLPEGSWANNIWAATIVLR